MSRAAHRALCVVTLGAVVASGAAAQDATATRSADSLELAIGRTTLAAGRASVAVAHLSGAVARVATRAQDPEFAAALARAHLARGDRAAAAQAIAPVRGALGPDAARWDAWLSDRPPPPAPTEDGPPWVLRTAAEALARGDTAGALARAARAAADPSAASAAWWLTGWAELARGRGAAAAAAFRRVDQSPVRTRAALLESQAWLLADAPDSAVVASTRAATFAARDRPAPSVAWRLVADALVTAGATDLVERAVDSLRDPAAAAAAPDRLARFALDGEGAVRWDPPAERARALTALGGPLADPVVRAVVLGPATDAVASARLDAAIAELAAAVRAEGDRATARGRAQDSSRAAARRLARVEREAAVVIDSAAGLDATLAALRDTVTALQSRAVASRAAALAVVSARADSIAARATRAARLADSLDALGAAMAPYRAALSATRAAAAVMQRAATAVRTGFDSAWTRHPVELQRTRFAVAVARIAAVRDSLRARVTALRNGVARAQTEAAAATAAEASRDAIAAAAGVAQIASTRAAAVEVLAAELAARGARLDAAVAGDAVTARHLLAAARFHQVRNAVQAGGRARERVATDGTLGAALAAVDSALSAAADHPLRLTTRLYGAELLALDADARFARAQGRGSDTPDYGAALAAFTEVAERTTDVRQRRSAWFARGELAFAAGRHADAVTAFTWSAANGTPAQQVEAWFRLGESEFEVAARADGEARSAALDRAVRAYETALARAPAGEDVYFLALFKLGWTYYTKADRPSSPEYAQAVATFARLVREYDALPAERQGRLALRAEALDYMVIAFTQLGGAREAIAALGALPDPALRLQLLRRTGTALREQGDYANAAGAWDAAIDLAPTDTSALTTQRWIVDLYQDVLFDVAGAQRARLALVDRFAPGGAWATANPSNVDAAQIARERALRLAAQFELRARRPAAAAPLYTRYAAEFPAADSAQAMAAQQGEALFAVGDAAGASAAYARAAGLAADSTIARDAALAVAAGRNAVVAADSAWRRAPADSGAAGRFFTVSAAFATRWPSDPAARAAWLTRGRRAGERGWWPEMAASFSAFVAAYPDDAYAPDARRLAADALFRAGRPAEAQQGWVAARQAALVRGRRALADSITLARVAAAEQLADTLVARGAALAAVDSVYLPLAATLDTVTPADRTRRAQVLRNAVEVALAAPQGQVPADRLEAVIAAYVAADPRGRDVPAYRATQARLALAAGDTARAFATQRALIDAFPQWTGRADAMARLAAVLDSVGARRDAAAAYAAFSAAYPRDPRAADALYNAAVVAADGGDPTAAAGYYADFAQRFPRDSRAAGALAARLAALGAAGDSSAVEAELRRLCAGPPPPGLTARCAERRGRDAFAAAMALLPQYDSLTLVIPTKAQLTRDGVAAASRPKQELLRRITGHLTRAIGSGVPEWVAAASYHVGLVQLKYAEFLRDVTLPADLTDEERDAARRGAATQAQGWRDQARETWTLLIEKATAEHFAEHRWVTEARNALARETPP